MNNTKIKEYEEIGPKADAIELKVKQTLISEIQLLMETMDMKTFEYSCWDWDITIKGLKKGKILEASIYSLKSIRSELTARLDRKILSYKGIIKDYGKNLCPRCFSELRGDCRFCSHCGMDLRATIALNKASKNAPWLKEKSPRVTFGTDFTKDSIDKILGSPFAQNMFKNNDPDILIDVNGTYASVHPRLKNRIRHLEKVNKVLKEENEYLEKHATIDGDNACERKDKEISELKDENGELNERIENLKQRLGNQKKTIIQCDTKIKTLKDKDLENIHTIRSLKAKIAGLSSNGGGTFGSMKELQRICGEGLNDYYD